MGIHPALRAASGSAREEERARLAQSPARAPSVRSWVLRPSEPWEDRRAMGTQELWGLDETEGSGRQTAGKAPEPSNTDTTPGCDPREWTPQALGRGRPSGREPPRGTLGRGRCAGSTRSPQQFPRPQGACRFSVAQKTRDPPTDRVQRSARNGHYGSAPLLGPRFYRDRLSAAGKLGITVHVAPVVPFPQAVFRPSRDRDPITAGIGPDNETQTAGFPQVRFSLQELAADAQPGGIPARLFPRQRAFRRFLLTAPAASLTSCRRLTIHNESTRTSATVLP